VDHFTTIELSLHGNHIFDDVLARHLLKPIRRLCELFLTASPSSHPHLFSPSSRSSSIAQIINVRPELCAIAILSHIPRLLSVPNASSSRQWLLEWLKVIQSQCPPVIYQSFVDVLIVGSLESLMSLESVSDQSSIEVFGLPTMSASNVRAQCQDLLFRILSVSIRAEPQQFIHLCHSVPSTASRWQRLVFNRDPVATVATDDNASKSFLFMQVLRYLFSIDQDAFEWLASDASLGSFVLERYVNCKHNRHHRLFSTTLDPDNENDVISQLIGNIFQQHWNSLPFELQQQIYESSPEFFKSSQ
jgi:hypothetical protein